MTPALYEACKAAFHIITPTGETLKAGQAGMFLLAELGYPGWLVRPWMQPPLVWLTDWGYYLVADNRPLFAKFLFTTDDGTTVLDKRLQVILWLMVGVAVLVGLWRGRGGRYQA